MTLADGDQISTAGAAAARRPALAVHWSLIAFAAVALLEVAMCLLHAPWRDETQALLIAREP